MPLSIRCQSQATGTIRKSPPKAAPILAPKAAPALTPHVINAAVTRRLRCIATTGSRTSVYESDEVPSGVTKGLKS